MSEEIFANFVRCAFEGHFLQSLIFGCLKHFGRHISAIKRVVYEFAKVGFDLIRSTLRHFSAKFVELFIGHVVDVGLLGVDHFIVWKKIVWNYNFNLSQP